MDLTSQYLDGISAGEDAAKAWARSGSVTAPMCPYLASSPSWAAWLVGYQHGKTGYTTDLMQAVKCSQSRGYTLKLTHRNGRTAVVRYPNT